MMEEIITQFSGIAGSAQPIARTDGYWVDSDPKGICKVAQAMKDRQARLSTITATAREDGETDLIYHFICEKTPLNIRVTTTQQSLPSLANLLPAANWIEREIHDLYAVQFEGHPDMRRLTRPPEMPEGFFRRPGGAAAKRKG
jgi:NADH:ubiquinone oxidoreductase subunit C